MTRTITAMFDDYEDASQAVRRLKSAGIPDADISIIGNNAESRAHGSHDHDADATGTGATLGTVVGGGAGLLTGLGLMAIPGVGPVVAAGWLVSTLVGAGAGAAVGAATGGVVDALSHAGVHEDDAHAYAEGIRRGGTLVTVRADESQAARAADILDDEGTVNMDEREQSWRSEGWNNRFGETGTMASDATAGGMGTAGFGSSGTGSTGIGATGVGSTSGGSLSGASTAGLAGASSMGSSGMGSSAGSSLGGTGRREVNRGRVRIHTSSV